MGFCIENILRKKLVFLIPVILISTFFGQNSDLNKKHILTTEVTAKYFAGEGGGSFLAGGGMRINLPAGAMLGAGLHGGVLFHDTDDFLYADDAGKSYYFDRKISQGYIEVFTGYEFFEDKDFNPYIKVGIGFWNYKVDANDVDSSSLEAIDFTSEMKTVVPIAIGCEIKHLKWVTFSPYIQYDYYLDEQEMLYYEANSDAVPSAPLETLDLNDWRGNLSFGLTIGIPIKVASY